METSIIKTFSIDTETLTKLRKIVKITDMNRSVLIRGFINYFYESSERLEELIKENEKK